MAKSAVQLDQYQGQNPDTAGKKFLCVDVPPFEYEKDPSIIENRSQLLVLMSRVLTVDKVHRILAIRDEADSRQLFYSVAKDFGARELERLDKIYASFAHSGLPMYHLEVIDCACGTDGACNSLHLQDLRTNFTHDYTDLRKKLELRYGADKVGVNGSMARLFDILKVAAQMDPDGKTDFDARLNKVTAEGFGCEEIVRHQARVAPFGPEHISSQELKTLCFKVNIARPKNLSPFIVMVNTMADREVDISMVKKLLKDAGWGNKFDVRPAEISEEFDMEKGEVHPLSLPPRLAEGDGQYSVVHIYDSRLKAQRYVTTNGGHPDWTTEFRSDAFVERMEEYFNVLEGKKIVLVDDIGKSKDDEKETFATGTQREAVWEHTIEVISEVEAEVVAEAVADSDPYAEFYIQKAALLVTETTTLFSERVREIIGKFKLDDFSSKTSLHRLAQPGLDFEVVKFPQCWRKVFEQLSVAIATMVREGINTVFLDCNIAPLEDILCDKMPRHVKEYVIEILRLNLGEELKDVSDAELLSEINERLVLLSKPVVIADDLRERAMRGEIKEVYLVGGAQIADPSISKYHDHFLSLGDLIKVHTLDPEQIRNIRDAMYFAEYEDAEKDNRLQNVLQLYKVVSPMLESIEKAEKPLIVIASTSLCQAYYDNGNEIIPEDLVEKLAENLGMSVAEMRAERNRINAVAVLNTTDVYANAAALNLATGIQLYGYSYV